MAFVGTRRALLSSTAKKPAASWNFAGQGQLPSWLSFSRASNATNFNSSGNLVYAPNNLVTNAAFTGAVVGSPGTLPTNGATYIGSTGTIARSVVGFGTDSTTGFPYIDLRWAGTATSSGELSFYAENPGFAALPGTNGIATAYVALVGGSLSNITSVVIRVLAYNGASYISEVATATSGLNATPQRVSRTSTAPANTTKFIVPITANVTGAGAVDLTLRYILPQFSIITAAQSSIPDMPATTGSAYYGPRFDYDPTTLAAKGLLLEGARTNSIRNNTMQGAVAGTPGTDATNWSIGGATGLTKTIATGTVSGMTYVDYRFSGTTGNTFTTIFLDASSVIAASTNSVWVQSGYFALTAGTLTNISSIFLLTRAQNAGATTLNDYATGFTPTGTLTRRSQTNNIPDATVAFLRPAIGINYLSGVAVDFTLRIVLPQLETVSATSQTASSSIPTYGSALTRSADIATITGAPATILASVQGTALVETTQAANYVGANARLIGADVRFVIGTGSPSGNLINFSSDNTLLSTSNPTWTSTARGAIGWSASGRTLVATGVASVSDAKPLATNASFWLGSQSGASNTYADGWYSRVAFWNTRLPDAVLTAKCILGSPL